MSEYIYEHKPSGADHMGKPVELPTLVQREEIVRCRDCRHFHPMEGTALSCRLPHPQYGHLVQWQFAEPDGFCAWAERKDGRK